MTAKKHIIKIRRLDKKHVVLGGIVLIALVAIITSIIMIQTKSNAKNKTNQDDSSSTIEQIVEDETDDTGGPIIWDKEYTVSWEYVNIRTTPEIRDDNTFCVVYSGNKVAQINGQREYDPDSGIYWLFVSVNTTNYNGDPILVSGWIAEKTLTSN